MPFSLDCSYRRPATSAADSKKFFDQVSASSAVGHSSILVGDFSVPLNSIHSIENSTCFLDEFLALTSFFFLGSEPTLSGHFLDLLLSNDPALTSQFSLAPNFSTSDHSSIIFCIGTFWSFPSPSPSSFGFDFVHTDWTSLNSFFSRIDWDSLFRDSVGIDEAYESFLSLIYRGIALFVPKRARKIRKRCIPPSMWKLADKQHFLWCNRFLPGGFEAFKV